MTLPLEPKDGDFVAYLAQIEQRQMQDLARQHSAHASPTARAQARYTAATNSVRAAAQPRAAAPQAPAPMAPSAPNPGRAASPSLLSAVIVMLLGMASFLYGAANDGGIGFIAIACVLIWLGARRLARRAAAAAR